MIQEIIVGLCLGVPLFLLIIFIKIKADKELEKVNRVFDDLEELAPLLDSQADSMYGIEHGEYVKAISGDFYAHGTVESFNGRELILDEAVVYGSHMTHRIVMIDPKAIIKVKGEE